MKDSHSYSLPRVLTAALLVIAVAVLAMQVIWAGPTATPRETALFSVLQFVFATLFSWLLTRLAAKAEFHESQRQFALAAYRRIKEIDSGVERLLGRLRIGLASDSEDVKREAEVANVIAKGIRESIKSSMADWADVIGEEILTVDKIAQIRADVGAAEPSQVFEPDGQPMQPAPVRTEQQAARVDMLLASLPPSLRIIAESQTAKSDPVDILAEELIDEARKGESLTLRAFWDETCDANISQLKVGDAVRLEIRPMQGRRYPPVVSTLDGRAVGVVANIWNVPFYVFREAISLLLPGVSGDARIVEIDSSNTGKRQYFRIHLPIRSSHQPTLVGGRRPSRFSRDRTEEAKEVASGMSSLPS